MCENENNHLAGNVYVMFESAEDAYNANLQLNQEWFNGKPVYSDLSPVNDFNDACCEEYRIITIANVVQCTTCM